MARIDIALLGVVLFAGWGGGALGGSAGDGAVNAAAPDLAPVEKIRIEGTRAVHQRNDQAGEERGLDLTQSPIGALIPEGQGSFLAIPGGGSVDGSVFVDEVPAGPVYLHCRDWLYAVTTKPGAAAPAATSTGAALPVAATARAAPWPAPPRGHPGREASPPIGPDAPGRARRLAWSVLRKRIWGFDVLVRPTCAGPMRLVAAIEDPDVARRISNPLRLPTRAPPRAGPWRPAAARARPPRPGDDDNGADPPSLFQ